MKLTQEQSQAFNKYCGWLLVPCGRADGKQRFRARLMFRQDKDMKMSQEECRALGRVFADWPRCVAEGDAALALRVYTRRGTRQVPASGATLAAGYRMYLGSLGGSLHEQRERVGKIWRAAFPDPGTPREIYGPIPTKSGWLVDRAGNEKYLTALHGGLHALALAKSLRAPGIRPDLAGHEAFDFARAPRELAGDAVKLAARLDRFAQSLTSPADRRSSPPPRESTFEQTRWSDRVIDGDSRFKASKDVKDLRAEDFDVLNEIIAASSETDSTTQDLQKLLETRPVAQSLKLADEVKKLGQHGWLMRHLGLVVELEVDMSALADDGQHDLKKEFLPGVVAIDGDGRPLDAPDDLPDDEKSPIPLRQGVFDLSVARSDGKPRYVVTQFDQQGALNKFVVGIKGYLSQRAAGASGGEQSYEFAAQRTLSLSLLDTRAPSKPERALDNRSIDEALYAHQIMIGMRVDVQRHNSPLPTKPAHGTAPWRSLMGWRVLDARINNEDISDWFGNVSAGECLLAPTQRVVSDARQGQAVISQSLFAWDGWSLAVPLPDPGGEGYGSATSELEIGRLKVRLVTAGGLPALRVGSDYRLGVRAVYADGFGPSLDDVVRAGMYEAVETGNICHSAALGRSCDEFFPFKRFEPIAPPDVHLGDRPDYDKLPQQAGGKVVLASSGDVARVHRREVRWIVPPPISLELAVMLGAYDRKGMRAGPPQSAFEGICLTPSGRFPNTSNPVAGMGGEGRPHRHDNSDTIYRRSAFARRPVIPYLPDPWARRVVLAAHRRSDGRPVAFSFHDYYEGRGAAGWPDCRALRLEILRADDGRVPGPRTVFERDANDRATIRLRVAAGDDLDVHLWHEMRIDHLEQSATVDALVDFLQTPDGIETAMVLQLLTKDEAPNWLTVWRRLVDRLAHWQEMRDHPLRAQTADLLADGLTNLTSFGMLNPSQVLRVVHAVDKPAAPRLLWSGLPPAELAPNAADRDVRVLPAVNLTAREETFRFVREPGRSDALLAGDLEIERATTARIDIKLAWSDTDDIPGTAPPQEHAKTALVSLDHLPHALSVPGAAHSPNALPAPAMAEDDRLVLLNGVRTSLSRVTNEDLKGGELRADFGDSRARKVDVEITAQSRFASEFQGAPAEFLSAPGVLRHVVVPSSAVPPRPDVDYVMPQYLWLESGPNHSAHERVGGCFRIWLRRPWFSSGFGEKLAIVCWPDEDFNRASMRRRAASAIARLCGINNDPPAFLEPFITRWGLDPLWGVAESNACIGSIPVEAFRKHTCDGISDLQNARASACFPVVDLRRAVSMKDHLASYRSESAKVALVLYEPKYDPPSRRYYVDVQIDERYTYFPFVRLSLARYQENALPGYELSELTVQEFVQLPPSRRASVAARPLVSGHLEVRVSLAGVQPAPPLTALHRRGTRVTAHLEYLPSERWQALRSAVVGDAGVHGVAWVPELHTSMVLERVGGEWRQKAEDIRRAYAMRPDCLYSVVVQEFEFGRADPPGGGTPGGSVSNRLVFSDRLLLSEVL
ncbi:hypothetical protein HZ992_18880 [Rhizobacter sp. AJA081-3]|uniref:hypothetical protein n=1 Tax=Rhizobacter sp. AJA081-3 TaxID=2753607 RepID=UPI001ADEFB94|nr:hypothetical protein [Rhizobacter sp. AJA081-3]QTN22206.1 hypothetical protein HZ992_18880 [Rhizobacter sp. AJA081-3]